MRDEFIPETVLKWAADVIFFVSLEEFKTVSTVK
jgi:hypothetical protein